MKSLPRLLAATALACAWTATMTPLPALAASYQIPVEGICDPNNALNCWGGVTSTNASGTVASGGTYQTVLASSATRKGCTIQNPTTATEALNVRVAGTAVFTLSAGMTFSCATGTGAVITDLIEVTAATTSHAFTAVSQ